MMIESPCSGRRSLSLSPLSSFALSLALHPALTPPPPPLPFGHPPTPQHPSPQYSRAYPERKPPRASGHLPSKSREERMKGILNYRNIYVKVFGETPMADMEVILPEKVVGIKAMTLVNLAVTVFTALTTGALMLWRVSFVFAFFLSGDSARVVISFAQRTSHLPFPPSAPHPTTTNNRPAPRSTSTSSTPLLPSCSRAASKSTAKPTQRKPRRSN